MPRRTHKPDEPSTGRWTAQKCNEVLASLTGKKPPPRENPFSWEPGKKGV